MRAGPGILEGRCHVIDGDTIVIDGIKLRLAGIDAPELDHPWGLKSKWTLVHLCRWQTVTARLRPELSYDRVVAECFLPDGRDLAAELVKRGLALDWPKFSGGKYRHLEPPDARQKLWRANVRQGARLPAAAARPVQQRPSPRFEAQYRARETLTPYKAPRRFNLFWIGWLVVLAMLVMTVGCALVGGGDQTASSPRPAAVSTKPAAPTKRLEVTASVLNVRERPSAGSEVITQLHRGTQVVVSGVSGSWFGIVLADGRIGWVYGDFVNPVGE